MGDVSGVAACNIALLQLAFLKRQTDNKWKRSYLFGAAALRVFILASISFPLIQAFLFTSE